MLIILYFLGVFVMMAVTFIFLLWLHTFLDFFSLLTVLHFVHEVDCNEVLVLFLLENVLNPFI